MALLEPTIYFGNKMAGAQKLAWGRFLCNLVCFLLVHREIFIVLYMHGKVSYSLLWTAICPCYGNKMAASQKPAFEQFWMWFFNSHRTLEHWKLVHWNIHEWNILLKCNVGLCSLFSKKWVNSVEWGTRLNYHLICVCTSIEWKLL